jgi:Uncharacterized protein conserved in bacteria
MCVYAKIVALNNSTIGDFVEGNIMEKTIQAYNKKLDNYYDSEGRLIQYPSKRPMRIIVLIKITEQMDANRKYTEKEINEIIRLNIAFGDIELIRREMYQYKLIGRLRDGSEYWVENDWRNVYAEYIRED